MPQNQNQNTVFSSGSDDYEEDFLGVNQPNKEFKLSNKDLNPALD